MNGNNIKIEEITPVYCAGVVSGDYSAETNDTCIEVTCRYVNEKQTMSARVDVDMDYNMIDFSNPESISKGMKINALNQALIMFTEYYIDCEQITGDFGIDMMVDTEEGEYNIHNWDVCMFHDAIIGMRGEDKEKLCNHLLSRIPDRDTVSDRDTESQEEYIYLDFCNYTIEEVEELINTCNKMGMVKIPNDNGFDMIMKGNKDYVFINNDEFDGNIEEAIIYTISDGSRKSDLQGLKEHLLDLQMENEDHFESLERDELMVEDYRGDKMNDNVFGELGGYVLLTEADTVNVGDRVTVVNANCEFDNQFDNVYGCFNSNDLDDYTVDLELEGVDFSNYNVEKSNNGGCYAFAECRVTRVY